MSDSDNIKYELVNHDTVFAGTAVEIVQQMREQAFFERGVDLSVYLGQLADLILQIAGVEITLEGESLDERAESFVRGLVAAGYFKEA